MNSIAVKAVKSGHLLETPMSYITKWMAGVFAASGVLVWANRKAFNVPPYTLEPEWIADSAKHGPIATREGAPPVFLNPISLNLPGGVRGPEDVPGGN